MIKTVGLLALLPTLLICSITNAETLELSVFTEEWPPYNYEEEGNIKGAMMISGVCGRRGAV